MRAFKRSVDHVPFSQQIFLGALNYNKPSVGSETGGYALFVKMDLKLIIYNDSLNFFFDPFIIEGR